MAGSATAPPPARRRPTAASGDHSSCLRQQQWRRSGESAGDTRQPTRHPTRAHRFEADGVDCRYEYAYKRGRGLPLTLDIDFFVLILDCAQKGPPGKSADSRGSGIFDLRFVGRRRLMSLSCLRRTFPQSSKLLLLLRVFSGMPCACPDCLYGCFHRPFQPGEDARIIHYIQ